MNSSYIKDYINTTMKNVDVIIPEKYIDQTLTTELFTIKFDVHHYTKQVIFEPIIKTENMMLAAMVTDNHIYYLKLLDDGSYIFETSGRIPVRWMYIIKDFFWKDITIKDSEYKLYDVNIFDNIPYIVCKNISKLSKYSFALFSVDDERWLVSDTFMNDFTKSILNTSHDYLSCKNEKSSRAYTPFPAAEGGIGFSNDYIYSYTRFCGYMGTRRYNYAKGSTKFSSNHNNVEDLYCLYLLLKENKINVSPFTIRT